jgi:hypothetical protein
MMWTDVRQATAWAFIWLLLVTAGFLLARRPGETNSARWAAVSLPLILLLAALARSLPALWLPVGAGYDIESYRMVTDALLDGREVYDAALGRHPYLPFQMYIMGGMAWLSRATGLPYVAAIKLPAVLADVALTGLIYAVVVKGSSVNGDESPDYERGRDYRDTAGRRASVEARAGAAYLATLYALNPISLLVTSYHGQFEAVTLLLLTLAWLFWERGHAGLSAGALGLAVLNKTWPVVFLPVVLIRLRGWGARARYVALALGIPILFTLAYILLFSPDVRFMLGRALTHRGVAGYWGPGAILNPLAAARPGLQPAVDTLFALRNGLLAAAALFTLWWTRRQSALDALLTLLLGLFVVTVGFGIQWLVWLVPFALLAGEDRWLKAYSLAGAFMMVVHLFGLHMIPLLGEWLPATAADWTLRLSGLPAWGVVVAWAFHRCRTAQSSHSPARPLPDPLAQ